MKAVGRGFCGLIGITFLTALNLAHAQDCPFADSLVVVDTLDPSGYYPLNVGNLWEYTIMDGGFAGNPWREEVVKDTLVQDMIFHKVKTIGFEFLCNPLRITRSRESYRYAAVTDTSIVSWLGEDRFDTNPIRFNQPFNTCYRSEYDLYVVYGAYDTSFEIEVNDETMTYAVSAIKQFEIASLTTYVHGVGRARTHGDPNLISRLAYAEVDSMIYGVPLTERYEVAVSNEPPSDLQSQTRIEVYPNPFSTSLRIRVQLGGGEQARNDEMTIQIVNALGRVVGYVTQQASEHTLRWKASGLAAGVYFVEIVSKGRVLKRTPVFHVR